MANNRIILHDLSGNNLYPVTSASLVSGLDAKIKNLISSETTVTLTTSGVALSTNSIITDVQLEGKNLKLTFGTLHSAGAQTSNGFVKVTTDQYGHVTGVTNVTIDDVLGLSDTGNKDKSIATEAYVDGKLSEGISAAQALHFCGTASNTDEVTNQTLGAVYIVSGDWEFNDEKVESGDMIVCTVAGKPGDGEHQAVSAKYTVIQANINGAVTSGANLDVNNLVAGAGNKSVVKTNIAVTNVVTAEANIASGNLTLGNGEKGLTDSGIGIGDVKTALNVTDTKADAGKVWTATATGGQWADPNHISVKAGTGIDVTGESLEKTIALSTVTASSTNGTAITLTTGTGSVNAVTGVTVDSYGRVTGVEKTSFSVTLPAVPVQGASNGLKLDGTTVKHDVTLSNGKNTDVDQLKFGSSFVVENVTRDDYGHVTKVDTKTYTLPAAPAEVTASGDGVVLATNVSGEIKVSHVAKLGTAVNVGGNTAGSVNHGGKVKIPSISVDTYGHVTSASDVEITLPSDQKTFDKIDGKVVPAGSSLADSGLALGTLEAGVGSTIHLGTGLALMPGTNSSASIVAALTYTVVNAGDVSDTEIFA